MSKLRWTLRAQSDLVEIGPREGFQRRASTLARPQEDLGAEEPVAEDVDRPRIAV
jgi:hypothetical protein